MKFGEADVRRAAAFARVALPPGRAAEIAAELAPLVALLDPLRHVRPEPAGGAVGVGAGGMPLRLDAGPAYDLARSPRELAAATRAGYVVVPRATPGPVTPLGADPGALDARGGTSAADGLDADGLVTDVLADDAFAAELEGTR